MILARQQLAQGLGGQEILGHDDVFGVVVQDVNELAVDVLVGRTQPLGVAEHHDRDALVAIFVERFRHFLGRDQRRRIVRQDGHRVCL